MSDHLQPARRISDRLLVVLAATLAAVLIISVVAALAFWHTPSAQPVEVPTVQEA